MKFIGDHKIALVTLFVFALSIYLALYGHNDSPENRTAAVISSNDSVYKYRISTAPNLSFSKDVNRSYSLHYDFYRESCPPAERFIGKAGCDASILLNAHESFASEKDASPNLYLKGFDVIDDIKYKLETVCPGVVSCSDIIALAAREAVLVAGGPFFVLKTGRKDSTMSFKDIAERELPSPQASMLEILARLFSRGFNERETEHTALALCTADSFKTVSTTSQEPASLTLNSIQALKTKCPFSQSQSPSPSAASNCSNNYHMSSGKRNNQVIDLSFNCEGGELNFGTRYYRRLLQNKGLLFSDQQLTSREETEIWVRAYASDHKLFRHDFATSMMKLSSYHVLTGPLGQVRANCSQVLP